MLFFISQLKHEMVLSSAQNICLKGWVRTFPAEKVCFTESMCIKVKSIGIFSCVVVYGSMGEIRIWEEVGDDISFSRNCLTNRFSFITLKDNVV